MTLKLILYYKIYNYYNQIYYEILKKKLIFIKKKFIKN